LKNEKFESAFFVLILPNLRSFGINMSFAVGTFAKIALFAKIAFFSIFE